MSIKLKEGKDFTLNELKKRLIKMNIEIESNLPKKYYINEYNEAIKNEKNREKIKNELNEDLNLNEINLSHKRNLYENKIDSINLQNEKTRRKSIVKEGKLTELHFIKESNEKDKKQISLFYSDDGQKIIIINNIKYKLVPINNNNNNNSNNLNNTNEELRVSQVSFDNLNDGFVKMKGEDFKIIPYEEDNNNYISNKDNNIIEQRKNYYDKKFHTPNQFHNNLDIKNIDQFTF